MQFRYGRYELDDDPARVDIEAAWRFLSTEAYWGKGRTRRDFDTQLASSWRIVGAYDASTGAMVGFARAVSDGGSDGRGNAYLADVYVLAPHRGGGLGRELIAMMIDRGPGSRFRWMLHTQDAHEFYARFGFRPADERFLERPKADDPASDPPADPASDAADDQPAGREGRQA